MGRGWGRGLDICRMMGREGSDDDIVGRGEGQKEGRLCTSVRAQGTIDRRYIDGGGGEKVISSHGIPSPSDLRGRHVYLKALQGEIEGNDWHRRVCVGVARAVLLSSRRVEGGDRGEA